jgi:hypothetical protein
MRSRRYPWDKASGAAFCCLEPIWYQGGGDLHGDDLPFVLVEGNLIWGSSAHHLAMGRAYRWSRAWNACILAAALLDLQPDTPAWYLASILDQSGLAPGLVNELQLQFQPVPAELSTSDLCEVVPPMAWPIDPVNRPGLSL